MERNAGILPRHSSTVPFGGVKQAPVNEAVQRTFILSLPRKGWSMDPNAQRQVFEHGFVPFQLPLFTL